MYKVQPFVWVLIQETIHFVFDLSSLWFRHVRKKAIFFLLIQLIDFHYKRKNVISLTDIFIIDHIYNEEDRNDFVW